MTVYLYVGEGNIIEGWGTTFAEGMIEHDLDPSDPVLMNFGVLRLVDGTVVADDTIAIDIAKKDKDEELNAKCKEAILAGFEYTIDGVNYWFSYDMEAQGNFRDASDALNGGMVPELPWTVRIGGIDGEYGRVMVNARLILELRVAGMTHKSEKISKYRDFLMPIVDQAVSSEEIESVVW